MVHKHRTQEGRLPTTVSMSAMNEDRYKAFVFVLSPFFCVHRVRFYHHSFIHSFIHSYIHDHDDHDGFHVDAERDFSPRSFIT